MDISHKQLDTPPSGPPIRRVKVNGEWFDLLLSEEQIRQRVVEIGRQLKSEYAGKVPIFMGVLNGAYIFMADLMREFDGDCEMDFMKLSSYGDRKISSGSVSVVKDFSANLENRDVIIVEDVIDSGLSMTFIRNLILSHHPASLRIATFLHKPEVSTIDFPIDYTAFEIPKWFVIGYGLDYAQKARNLKEVYILSPDQKD